MSRGYLVSLPVAITVTGGAVSYEVDTSEAGQAVLEDDGHLYFEGDLGEDVEAIEADHARRALDRAYASLGRLAAKGLDRTDAEQAEYDGLCLFIAGAERRGA